MRHNSRCCSLIHCFSRVNHCSASRTPSDCARAPMAGTTPGARFVAICIEFSTPRVKALTTPYAGVTNLFNSQAECASNKQETKKEIGSGQAEANGGQYV